MADLPTLCGQEVRTAGDGAQALEAAAQFCPQLVLSDLELKPCFHPKTATRATAR